MLVIGVMMASEEIRVDCALLTQDGRYVVTSSIYGPPQVWDLRVSEGRGGMCWREGVAGISENTDTTTGQGLS